MIWVAVSSAAVVLVGIVFLSCAHYTMQSDMEKTVKQLRMDVDYMLGLGKRVYTDKEKSVIMYFRGLPPSETSSFHGYCHWIAGNAEWAPHEADFETYTEVKGLFREGCR